MVFCKSFKAVFVFSLFQHLFSLWLLFECPVDNNCQTITTPRKDFRIYLQKSCRLEWFILWNERANVSFQNKVDKTVFWAKFSKVDKIDFSQKINFLWIKLSWIKRLLKKVDKTGSPIKSTWSILNQKGTENEILRFWGISNKNANANTWQNHLSHGFWGISYYFPN